MRLIRRLSVNMRNAVFKIQKLNSVVCVVVRQKDYQQRKVMFTHTIRSDFNKSTINELKVNVAKVKYIHKFEIQFCSIQFNNSNYFLFKLNGKIGLAQIS